MMMLLLYVCLGLGNIIPALASTTSYATLNRRNFQYKLPDGYTLERTTGFGELDPGYFYGAAIIAMISLAYEDSSTLTDPVSYPWPTFTLNITGATESSQYYRQFASYTLYNALETMTSSNNFTTSNFTLQNAAGGIACKVVIAPPNSDYQRLIGGYNGGIGPRSKGQPVLPIILQPRQAGLINESSALEALTPLHATDWYGPQSTTEDFFMALATLIAKVSDIKDKDHFVNTQSVEKEGYHLNVTNVPLPGQTDYLTNRGVLNLCAYAYGEVSERLGYGINPVTNFETMLLWTNGTALLNQHVLRYEGHGVV